jgi:uncharacterized protein YycO
MHMLRFAAYLAQPIKQHAAAGAARLQAGALLPGDVLLVDGNTRGAALVRRVTRSAWSHVAMYVGPLEEGADPRCVVEADVVAGVRAVRLSELKGLNVRVLRPKGLGEAERRRLAEWVVSRIGQAYDLAHAWLLAMRLLRLPFGPRRNSTTRFICSTLLAQAFFLVGYAVTADPRYVTPGDFERTSLFDVVGAA